MSLELIQKIPSNHVSDSQVGSSFRFVNSSCEGGSGSEGYILNIIQVNSLEDVEIVPVPKIIKKVLVR
jgi:hypothetical protein